VKERKQLKSLCGDGVVTPLSLKSLCGGGVPFSHPSLGLSLFFLSFWRRRAVLPSLPFLFSFLQTAWRVVRFIYCCFSLVRPSWKLCSPPSPTSSYATSPSASLPAPCYRFPQRRCSAAITAHVVVQRDYSFVCHRMCPSGAHRETITHDTPIGASVGVFLFVSHNDQCRI